MAVLNINGVSHVVDAPGDTKLLWVIRRGFASHRHEVRMRHWPLWGLYGSPEW